MEFTPVSATIGGVLLGIAAVLLLKLNGRIAGISGILNSALSIRQDDRMWRVLFVGGLIIGGFLYQHFSSVSLLTRENFPLVQLVVAGLLVGFGTRLGSGCTSGHGVCGIARLSPRSIIATLIFLGCGMLTATLVFSILGAE